MASVSSAARRERRASASSYMWAWRCAGGRRPVTHAGAGVGRELPRRCAPSGAHTLRLLRNSADTTRRASRIGLRQSSHLRVRTPLGAPLGWHQDNRVGADLPVLATAGCPSAHRPGRQQNAPRSAALPPPGPTPNCRRPLLGLDIALVIGPSIAAKREYRPRWRGHRPSNSRFAGIEASVVTSLAPTKPALANSHPDDDHVACGRIMRSGRA